jgi:hypothetical protein
MRIVGSAQSKLKQVVNLVTTYAELEEAAQTKTLLMGSRGGPNRTKLDSMPEKYQTEGAKTGDLSIPKEPSGMLNLKNVKLTGDE